MKGSTMTKIDLKKEEKALYQPSAKAVAEIAVPTMNYLMIDGSGDPNTAAAYAAAVEALYAVAYALKFMVKKGDLAIDYVVMPLEGLWWAEDMHEFTVEDKSSWLWTMMIRQPDVIRTPLVTEAIANVQKKKGLAALEKMRFAAYDEGLCAQILHIGPFHAEGPTVAKVHAYIEENGYALRGKHHEIYLSDIRRAAPDKWRTVIRQPMKK